MGTETLIAVLAVVLIGGAVGYYLYRRRRRMLEAMSPEQRELYDAEKDYKRSVKKAERELWMATKAYEAKVLWAQGMLSRTMKQGQGKVASYTGVHGNTIELWENRVRVPHLGTKANWMESVASRSTKEHHFRTGPVAARVEKHGADELYLIVEGDNFVGFLQCRPDDAPKVRELAVKINNASRSIRSVLQARERAIAQATADLEAARANRAGIEAAEERLAVVKADTERLEAARARVGERGSEIEPGPLAE